MVLESPQEPTPSAAVEDYIKAIYTLGGAQGAPVSTRTIWPSAWACAASVSGMLGRLDESGLIERSRYHGVALTDSGLRLALGVIRRHRVVETYLTRVLGVPWDEVHDEAERLEHAVSHRVVDLMATRLGDPAFDPHGDPIPTTELQVVEEVGISLGAVEPPCRLQVVRVPDGEPELLRFLAGRGVEPGVELGLTRRDELAGVIELAVGERQVVLGLPLASRLRVREVAS